MKKKENIFTLLAIVAALALSSCTEKVWPDLGPISYEPVVMMSQVSRADEGGEGNHNIYSKDDSFGVWVAALDDNLTWKYDKDYANMMVDRGVVGWNGTEWNTSTPHAWPAEKILTVAAYSPASAQASFSNKEGVVFSDVDVLNKGSEELMFAGPICDKEYGVGGGVITIPFKHALCSVQFAVIPHLPDHISVVVRKISIGQLQHQGSFSSLPEPSWTTTGELCEQVVFEGSETVRPGEVRLLGEAKWLLPQVTTAHIKLLCDFVYENATLPNQVLEVSKSVAWQPGVGYLYSLKVYTDSLGFLHDNISAIIDD